MSKRVRTRPIQREDLHIPIAPAISPKEAGNGAKARKTKLAVMGLSADLLDAGDPRYAACIRLANAFRKARTKEMYELHGHVSSGVSALLASSAMALASARFLYEVAASTADGRPDLLAKAAKLSDSSRQNELSAWELCSRESILRKRIQDSGPNTPWLTGGESLKFGPAGNEYKKRGRPKKVELLASQSQETWTSRPRDSDAGINVREAETIGSGSGGQGEQQLSGEVGGEQDWSEPSEPASSGEDN